MMPFVAAKCPMCGGDLHINDDRETAFCQYCGSRLVVEKAIKLYQTVNNIHTENLKIELEKEFVIHAGELVEYNGASTDVIVPEGVFKIANAFTGMKYLHSVSLPNTIKEIGDSAFNGCENLETLYLPPECNKISVGKYAFVGCNKLLLPKALTNVPRNAYVCKVCGCVVETEGELASNFKCPVCSVPKTHFFPYGHG